MFALENNVRRRPQPLSLSRCNAQKARRRCRAVEAALKPDEMLAKGDMKGTKDWREAVKKIKALQESDWVTGH